jgi:hypothetical protein
MSGSPRTAAGRALLDRVSPPVGDNVDPEEEWVAEAWAHRNEIEGAILAIEAEAATPGESRTLVEALDARRDPLNVGQRRFFVTARGHGLSDWCSVHGDIPTNLSMARHIQVEHDLSYDDYRVLEQIDRHRAGVTDDEADEAERAAGIAAARLSEPPQ